MYRHNEEQLEFEDFNLPFGGRLRSDNRWVRLAKLIPWTEVEKVYASSLAGTGQGAPAMSVCVALGALIIKERIGASDEETVEQIRENHYLPIPVKTSICSEGNRPLVPDKSVQLFQSKASVSSERSDAGICYFPESFFLVKLECNFLMDSPFRMIL